MKKIVCVALLALAAVMNGQSPTLRTVGVVKLNVSLDTSGTSRWSAQYLPVTVAEISDDAHGVICYAFLVTNSNSLSVSCVKVGDAKNDN